MSSVYANIQVNVNTASAVKNLKALQLQASSTVAKMGAAHAAEAATAAAMLQAAAVSSGQFTARMLPATTAVQSFNDHLIKNRFSLGDYARYSAAATKETGLFNKALKSSGALLGQRSMIDAVATQRVKALATQYVQLGASVTGANKVMALTPAILNKSTAASQMALEKQRLMNMLIADGSTKMLNWGKNMQWAGRQLMVGFTLPLTLFAGIAISVFNDMEKQALEFKKVYGDLFTTEPEMEQNLEAVKKLGLEFTKYGIALKDTMKMATTAAASGQKNEDLIAATTEATRLQVLGQMEAQDAMATTISLQTAFRLSNTELTESVNFLNAVENQTVLTLQDVTEAIPRVATVINSFGGGVKELSVLLVGMKEGGVSAAEGANALKNSLARLITPTAAARKMTAAFGIDLEGIVKNNRGELIPMLTELATKLDGLGGTQRQEVLSTLFGKYQYARIGVMLQSLTDKSSQASTAMKLVNETTKDLAQTAERELGRVEDSTSSKFKSVVEKMKAGLIPIGEEFLKAAMPILETIGKIIEWFNGMGDTIKQTIVTLTTVVGIIAPTFLMMLGLFGNLIAQGIKTIQFLRRMAGTIAGNGKAWQRLTLEELEAQTMSSALSKQTVNTTGALMNQVGAINILNGQLKIYIQSLMQAAVASAALAGKGAPAMLGRVAKVKPPSNMLNDGGKVFDSSTSTYVPGTGNKDTVPAILTPGEFVVNKQATKENISILQAINNGEAVKRNKGGMIPGMQYFAANIRNRIVKPKPPASIPLKPTSMRLGNPINEAEAFGGAGARISFRENLNTEASRLHSLLQSVWFNRSSKRGVRTSLNPQGLLRPPRDQAPRVIEKDYPNYDSLPPAWVYSEKNIKKHAKKGYKLDNTIYVNEPMHVQRSDGLLYRANNPAAPEVKYAGEMLSSSPELSALLQHELFHASKPKFKYKSSKQQGLEESKAMIAQSIVEGSQSRSYYKVSETLKAGRMVSPENASLFSQEFGEEFLRHVTRTQSNRRRDIAGLKEFYGTSESKRANRGLAFNPAGYAEVRKDAALSKIFDSFIPVSSKSNSPLFESLTNAAIAAGIPRELIVRQVGNREILETSALLMNARNLGPEVFNDMFSRLLVNKVKTKTGGLEEFFGGILAGSGRRQDPLDRGVLNSLVENNLSFRSIKENNMFGQKFNQGGIILGYAGGGRVRTQVKKGLAKYNQERIVSGESMLASARAGLNEAQSRYGVIHRNYDVNPATEFLRNMGVLKPGALKQDIWDRVRNVRQFGLNHPELVSAPNEIFMKRDLRTETRRRVPQTTDPDYQPSYDKTLQRLIHRDDSTISMYSPIRINTASTKRGQARSGFDTGTSDAGYSRSSGNIKWANQKFKKDEMPGIYMDPKAREGDLFKKGLVEHEYSHQSRGVQTRGLSSPIEEARAMTTEISVTGKQIDRHYLESQQRRLEGKGVIQNADERQKNIEQIFEDIGKGRYSPKWIESHIDEIKRLQNNVAPFSALLPPSALGKTPHLASGVESRADKLRFMLIELEKMPRINPSKNPQSKKLIEDIFGTHNWRPYSATEVFAAGMINPMFAKSTPELSQSFLLSLMKEASSTPMSSSTLNLAAKKAMTKNFNTGDIVPGMGSKDTVPAMLTPGEFVVNKQSTQSNLGLLHQINNGNTPPELKGFNKGGPIPGVQYFGGGGQSSKGNLEFLHLFDRMMATEAQTQMLRDTSDNKLVKAATTALHPKNNQFGLYNNVGVIGHKDMQYERKPTGTKMSTLFTPDIMDRTMAPFYSAIAHESGQKLKTVMRNPAVQGPIREFGQKLGAALATQVAGNVVTPAIMKDLVTEAAKGNPTASRALAHASQATTLSYRVPGKKGAERAAITETQQRSVFNQQNPYPSYTGTWSKKGDKYLRDVADAMGRPIAGSAQPTGQATAGPQPKVMPAPLGRMPKIDIVPLVPRKDIQRQIRMAAQSKVLNQIVNQARIDMPQQRDSQGRFMPSTGPVAPVKYDLTEKTSSKERQRRALSNRNYEAAQKKYAADEKIYKTALRDQYNKTYQRMNGDALVAKELRNQQQKLGKQTMAIQKAENKRQAKIAAQTKDIGKNNAQLIAQQRDRILAQKGLNYKELSALASKNKVSKGFVGPLTQEQQQAKKARQSIIAAANQARREVLPQPEKAPREPRPMQKQPTTINQVARALAKRETSNLGVKQAQSSLNSLKAMAANPNVAKGSLAGLGQSIGAAQQKMTAEQKAYSKNLKDTQTKILKRLEARAKLGLDGDQRATKGQDANRQMLKKLGLVDPSTLPKKERQAQRMSNKAYLNTEAGRQAYNQAMPAILAPSMRQRIQEARQAATSKVKSPLSKYNNAWQNRTGGATFFKSGAVPVLNEKGKQVKGPNGPMTQKAQSKMQKGAGKAAGGVGTIGMMASMMPMFMQDDKGKFMGMDPMAAMGGIMGMSMLAQGIKAMIGSATAAVATVGMALGGIAVAAVAAGIAIKMWRDSVNSSAKAAAELGANLGGAANAANKIGKVMGIDTPLQRQAKMQMGFLGEEQKLANDRFGQALSSDQGKAFVEELKKGTTAQRISKTQDYMSTAIATKQLTVEDAKLFTKTLATALGDPVMGTAVVRSISSAMASPNAMKGLADKRLKAVEGNAAIAEVMRAPSLGNIGYQKSISTDGSAFAIGSAVQVIQDYSNVIAMTREQYQQGIIDFEKYNSVIRESTAIQNKYSEILSKAVGGAVDVQGARMALDTQLVAGGMSQEQVDALTHSTDIGVSRTSALGRLTGVGVGNGTGNGGLLGTIFGSSLSSYQSQYVSREAQKSKEQGGYDTTDSNLTDEQRQKLIDESLLAQEAATKMFEGGLNENLKAAVLAGKMTAEAAAALGQQLMNNSLGEGAIQYQKMAEQGKGVLGFEQAGFIETTNAMGVDGLKNTDKYIDVALKFSESGGSLAEYQTFFNSIPTGKKQVYVDVLARTTYEGQTSVLSGGTSIVGAYGEELGGKILSSKGAIAAAESTRVNPSGASPNKRGGAPTSAPLAPVTTGRGGGFNPGGVRGTPGNPSGTAEPFEPLKSDTSKNDAYTKSVTSLVDKLGSQQTAYNITVAAATSLNGRPATASNMAEAINKYGSSVDYIQRTLPEEVYRDINLNTTDPKEIERWNLVSRSFADGWLTLSKLNPNIKMASVVEFLTVEKDAEGNPIQLSEEERAKRLNSLNDAYSDLEKSKDINIRKKAYITLAAAEIKDEEGNAIDPAVIDSKLSELVSKFGKQVLFLPTAELIQFVNLKVDASKLRADAAAMLAGPNGKEYGVARIAGQMIATANSLELQGDTAMGPALNNLKNSKSGGGGGKKENPIKDMNKGFLDQIKMYTNMDANLKRLNDARGKFAASLTKGKGIIQKLREAGISEGIISELASKGFDALKQGYNKFVTKGRANALGRNENELARIAAVGSATNDVATAVTNAKNQTRGAKVLRGMEGTAKEVKGMTLNAEELSQALDDPALADAFANVNTKEAQKQIQEYVNKVLKARPILEKAMREMADPRLVALEDISKLEESINAEIALKTADLTQKSEEKFRSDYKMTKAQADLQIAKNQMEIDAIQLEIDKKQESNDLDQHSIDLLEHSKKQHQDKIDLIQAGIDAYQKSIDAYQRENELRNQQANIINHSLDIMSQQEDEITDAYNKRIAALDEVAKINDYIINQQKGQLNLAQALSQGDVYAAAAAAQDMQAGSAQFAQDQMRTDLEKGKDNQVAGLTTETGLTRVQAEAELNRIKEMNYQNDLLVTALQNQIYTKTQEMIPYKDQIALIDKNIATYTETIWQRNNDIYNIEVGQIEPLQKANEELDRKLKTSNDQLAIDVKEAALQYETQLALLDLTAKGIELSLAQEAAAGAVAGQWKNILDLIIAANKALADKDTKASELKLLPTTSAAQAKANIAAAKLISDEAAATHADAIKKIKEMMIISVPAAAPAAGNFYGGIATMATGGVVGDGARDSIQTMLSPGEFVMRKASVQKYGMPMLSKMNMGAFEMPRYNTQQPIITSIQPTSNTSNINAPVYNTYSVNVSANTNASADDIANTVMTKIKRVDSMAVRSFRGY